MYKGTEVVALMESMLGSYGAQARAYCGLPSGAAWCNAQVSYAFYKCGVKKLYCDGRKETYCPHSIQWCYSNLADIPAYIALEGDVIYFDWELNGTPNHIGFVRNRVSDVQIDTVEGNTSGGKIANRTRDVKYVQAIFRPHYKVDKSQYDVTKSLTIDGLFGFNTIAKTQAVLGIKVDAILGKGTVKAIQKKVGVTADGSWGVKTTKGIQKMLKKEGLYDGNIDGYFGAKSAKGWQKWCNKHYKQPSPIKKTWRDRGIDWAKKIADDPKAGYRKWSSDKATHECLLCHPETDPKHKWYKYTWNCIGFLMALLKHGCGLPIKCSCHTIDNAWGNKALKWSNATALKSWEEHVGLKGWVIIKNKNGIPASKLQKCDALLYFEGNTFTHILAYAGNGKVVDCGGWSDKQKQIAFRKYSEKSCKIAFSYRGDAA